MYEDEIEEDGKIKNLKWIDNARQAAAEFSELSISQIKNVNLQISTKKSDKSEKQIFDCSSADTILTSTSIINESAVAQEKTTDMKKINQSIISILRTADNSQIYAKEKKKNSDSCIVADKSIEVFNSNISEPFHKESAISIDNLKTTSTEITDVADTNDFIDIRVQKEKKNSPVKKDHFHTNSVSEKKEEKLQYLETDCKDCKRFQQDFDDLKKQSQSNFRILKQKLVSTSELIAEYHKKIQDLAAESSKVKDLNKKLETCYGETGSLRIQLQKALQANEPLKKTIRRLEYEKILRESEHKQLKSDWNAATIESDKLKETINSLQVTQDSFKRTKDETEKQHEKEKKKVLNQAKLIDQLNEKLKVARERNKTQLKTLKKVQKENEKLSKTIERREKTTKLNHVQKRSNAGKASRTSPNGVLSPSPSPPPSPLSVPQLRKYGRLAKDNKNIATKINKRKTTTSSSSSSSTSSQVSSANSSNSSDSDSDDETLHELLVKNLEQQLVSPKRWSLPTHMLPTLSPMPLSPARRIVNNNVETSVYATTVPPPESLQIDSSAFMSEELSTKKDESTNNAIIDTFFTTVDDSTSDIQEEVCKLLDDLLLHVVGDGLHFHIDFYKNTLSEPSHESSNNHKRNIEERLNTLASTCRGDMLKNDLRVSETRGSGPGTEVKLERNILRKEPSSSNEECDMTNELCNKEDTTNNKTSDVIDQEVNVIVHDVLTETVSKDLLVSELSSSSDSDTDVPLLNNLKRKIQQRQFRKSRNSNTNKRKKMERDGKEKVSCNKEDSGFKRVKKSLALVNLGNTKKSCIDVDKESKGDTNNEEASSNAPLLLRTTETISRSVVSMSNHLPSFTLNRLEANTSQSLEDHENFRELIHKKSSFDSVEEDNGIHISMRDCYESVGQGASERESSTYKIEEHSSDQTSSKNTEGFQIDADDNVVHHIPLTVLAADQSAMQSYSETKSAGAKLFSTQHSGLDCAPAVEHQSSSDNTRNTSRSFKLSSISTENTVLIEKSPSKGMLNEHLAIIPDTDVEQTKEKDTKCNQIEPLTMQQEHNAEEEKTSFEASIKEIGPRKNKNKQTKNANKSNTADTSSARFDALDYEVASLELSATVNDTDSITNVADASEKYESLFSTKISNTSMDKTSTEKMNAPLPKPSCSITWKAKKPIVRRHSMLANNGASEALGTSRQRVDRTRSLSPSMFQPLSPPLSPIPPSPRRSMLTPLISPLPITPLPDSVSPLPPSPKITSPPLIRDTAVVYSENPSVCAPKPVCHLTAIKELNFSQNDRRKLNQFESNGTTTGLKPKVNNKNNLDAEHKKGVATSYDSPNFSRIDSKRIAHMNKLIPSVKVPLFVGIKRPSSSTVTAPGKLKKEKSDNVQQRDAKFKLPLGNVSTMKVATQSVCVKSKVIDTEPSISNDALARRDFKSKSTSSTLAALNTLVTNENNDQSTPLTIHESFVALDDTEKHLQVEPNPINEHSTEEKESLTHEKVHGNAIFSIGHEARVATNMPAKKIIALPFCSVPSSDDDALLIDAGEHVQRKSDTNIKLNQLQNGNAQVQVNKKIFTKQDANNSREDSDVTSVRLPSISSSIDISEESIVNACANQDGGEEEGELSGSDTENTFSTKTFANKLDYSEQLHCNSVNVSKSDSPGRKLNSKGTPTPELKATPCDSPKLFLAQISQTPKEKSRKMSKIKNRPKFQTEYTFAIKVLTKLHSKKEVSIDEVIQVLSLRHNISSAVDFAKALVFCLRKCQNTLMPSILRSLQSNDNDGMQCAETGISEHDTNDAIDNNDNLFCHHCRRSRSHADMNLKTTLQCNAFYLCHPNAKKLQTPCITKFENKLLLILQEVNLNSAPRELLSYLQKLILKEKDLLACEKMALLRFYASICRLQNNLEKLIAFVYCHAFDQLLRISFPMLFITCYSVWPSIVTRTDLLAVDKTDRDKLVLFKIKMSPLSAVIQLVALCDAAEKKDTTSQKILSSLTGISCKAENISRYYAEVMNELVMLLGNEELSFIKLTTDGDFDLCPFVFSVFKSMELVCTRLGWLWCYENIIDTQIWTILKNWSAGNERSDLAIIGIRLTGHLSRAAYSMGYRDLSSLLQFFSKFLQAISQDPNVPIKVHVAVAYTLLDMLPSQPECYRKVLHAWIEHIDKRRLNVPAKLRQAIANTSYLN